VKLPWTKEPEELYLPAPTVNLAPPPEPEDEGDVLWERDPSTELVERLGEHYRRLGPRLAWTRNRPTLPGLYWWRPYPLGDIPLNMAALELVIDYGGRLAVVSRKGGTTSYRSLFILPEREWCGPIGIPDDLDLDKWWGLKE
jgi:hypothetical protein